MRSCYHKAKLHYLILCQLIIICTPVNSILAQSIPVSKDLRFENFAYPQKFITGAVGNMMVDEQGYLWICTDALYRFDGVKAKKYSSFDNSSRGLKNNYCDDLLQDASGRIWIGNLVGLCYYDRFEDSIHYIQPPDKKIINYAYSYLIKNNYLWFVSNYGLCKLDLNNLTIDYTTLSDIKNPTGTYDLGNGKLGINTRDGFYVYTIDSDKAEKLNTEINGRRFRINDIKQKGRQFYIATDNGLIITENFSEWRQLTYSPSSFISSVLFDPSDRNQNRLWLATASNGLYLFDTNTEMILNNYTHDDLAPFSLPSNNIYKLYSDKSRNIWIGSEKGISLLQLQYQPYQTRFLSFINNNVDNHIGHFVADRFNKNIVWLACQNQGLLAIDWQTRQTISQFTNFNLPGTGLTVRDMIQLSANKWLLLFPYSVAYWNSGKGIEKTITPLEERPDLMNRFIKTSDSILYIASEKGLLKFDLHRNTISLIKNVSIEKLKRESLMLQNGFYDGNDHIWLASRAGVIEYNLRSENYRAHLSGSESSNPDFLNDIAPASEFSIYCAGMEGITLFDTRTKIFKPVELKGLHKPNCFGLYTDSNKLWINSNAGLLAIDEISNKIDRLTINSATDAYSFSRISKIGNNIVIGFRDAYAYINTTSSTERLPSDPLIENVFVNNKNLNLSQTNFRLRHWENNIRINFTAFNYSDASNIRFRYKLDGKETDWNYVDRERGINYAQLKPGTYNLVIQSGHMENWNTNVTRFEFVITPPFWQTWWFIGLIVLFAAISTVAIFKHRLKKVRRDAFIRQSMAETEMKALRAQMNPHFIFNCMATVDGLILQQKTIEASDYLSKFSRLVRMVLQNSMQPLIPLSKDLEALVLYIELERERQSPAFEFEVNVDKDLDTASICLPPLLLQPFVENAILHGLRHLTDKTGRLKIAIRRNEKNVVYIIDDNGIGRAGSEIINRSRQEEHQSLGGKLSESRIKNMRLLYGSDQSFEMIDKKNNEGTTVIIRLPYLTNCT